MRDSNCSVPPNRKRSLPNRVGSDVGCRDDHRAGRCVVLLAGAACALVLLTASTARAELFLQRCGGPKVGALTLKKACAKNPGKTVVRCRRRCVQRKGLRCQRREWRQFKLERCATGAGDKDLTIQLCRPMCKRRVGKNRLQFPQWEANNVKASRQRRTFFGTIWKPRRAKVRRIAIFSAGQQTVAGSGDHANLVAASFERYRRQFKRKECCKKVPLDRHGLAARFVQAQLPNSGWTDDNTLVVSVHDLQFNHIFLPGAKRKVLRSFYDWLSAHVDWANIDYVYLAGSSRGGCFSMRFGDFIMRKSVTPARTRFILQSVDGVCKRSQKEFGTHGPAFDNPIQSKRKYRVYPTDVRAQFPKERLRNICAFHIAGGEEVTGLGLRVHAFSDRSAKGKKEDIRLVERGHTFYRQQWSPYAHAALGRNHRLKPETVGLLWKRFQECMRSWRAR